MMDVQTNSRFCRSPTACGPDRAKMMAMCAGFFSGSKGAMPESLTCCCTNASKSTEPDTGSAPIDATSI